MADARPLAGSKSPQPTQPEQTQRAEVLPVSKTYLPDYCQQSDQVGLPAAITDCPSRIGDHLRDGAGAGVRIAVQVVSDSFNGAGNCQGHDFYGVRQRQVLALEPVEQCDRSVAAFFVYHVHSPRHVTSPRG